jgi:hypothetical protein
MSIQCGDVDNRIFCYRADGSCYAVFSPHEWRELRSRGQLDRELKRRRESGVRLLPAPDIVGDGLRVRAGFGGARGLAVGLRFKEPSEERD